MGNFTLYDILGMDCAVTILGRVNVSLVCVFVRMFRAFRFGLLKHFETLQSFMTKCSNLSDSLLRGLFFVFFYLFYLF